MAELAAPAVLPLLDYAAVAVFAASGALAAARKKHDVITFAFFAAVTGVLRDVLAYEPSILLRREIYVSAAVAGASADVALRTLGQGALVSGVAGVLVALLLRGGAIVRGWSLPGFPGRVR